jgi:uncharacterized protein (TIGR00290 family)
MALFKIMNDPNYEVLSLLTTVNEEYLRVSMHGVHMDMIKEQALQIGIPLEIVFVPKDSSNESYEKAMREKLLYFKSLGVERVVFGDIFLEDLKLYRETKLSEVDLEGLFPLWKKDTGELIKEFWSLGFQTIICCINNSVLPGEYSGKILSEHLVEKFPPNVDLCGENGEFHTFVFKGPIFKEDIRLKIAEQVIKSYVVKEEGDDKHSAVEYSYTFTEIHKA